MMASGGGYFFTQGVDGGGGLGQGVCGRGEQSNDLKYVVTQAYI